MVGTLATERTGKVNQDQPRRYGVGVHHRRKHGSGRGGLKRPKRPLSFQVTTVQNNPSDLPSIDSSSSSLPAAASPTVAIESALAKRVLLLNLIIRRNKNQHRNQLFFKDLCILRSSLVRLLDIVTQLESLSLPMPSSALTSNSDAVRRRFEAEARLRSQKELLEERVRDVFVPQCYVTFSGLVQDSQFANLGVVLVALLSEIALGKDGVGRIKDHGEKDSLVRKIATNEDAVWEEERTGPSSWSGSLHGTSTRMTGEDQGEVVERVYDIDTTGKKHSTIHDQGGTHRALMTDKEEHAEVLPRNSLQERERHSLLHYTSGTDVAERLAGSEQISINRKGSDPAGERETGKPKSKGKEKSKTNKPKSAIDDLFSGLL